MSFLDRIAECNRHDLSGFAPFRVAGARVGWIRHALAQRLSARRDVFARDADGALSLRDDLADHAARSAAMDDVVRGLERDGLVMRADAPHDKRLTEVSLTKQGRTLVKSTLTKRRAFLERMLQGVSADEVAVFLKTLEQIDRNLTAQ